MKKKLKLFTTILFVCAFALSVLCGCIWVDPDSGNAGGNNGNGGNNGGTTTSEPEKLEFESGNGTESDPYVIAKPYQWANISKHLGANYILTADLNMGDEGMIASIGTMDMPFTGYIDGQGHVIHSGEFNGKSGLFGVVSGGTIKNLSVKDSRMTATDTIAASFVGQVKMGATIENCHVIDVTFLFDTWRTRNKDDYIGGFVGQISSMSVIKYCSAKVVVRNIGDYQYTATYYVGGLVALMDGGTMDGCWVTGSFNGACAYYGGVVSNIVGGTISNVYSECTFSGSDRYKNTYLGGIACISDGGYHAEFALSFCTNQITTSAGFGGVWADLYYTKKVPFEDATSRHFDSVSLEKANALLDNDPQWGNNKLWRKGRLHPELVSYEEYLAITAGE